MAKFKCLTIFDIA